MTTQNYLYKIIILVYLHNVTAQDYLYMIGVEGLSLHDICYVLSQLWTPKPI